MLSLASCVAASAAKGLPESRAAVVGRKGAQGGNSPVRDVLMPREHCICAVRPLCQNLRTSSSVIRTKHYALKARCQPQNVGEVPCASASHHWLLLFSLLSWYSHGSSAEMHQTSGIAATAHCTEDPSSLAARVCSRRRAS